MKASLYSIKDNIAKTFGRIMEQNNSAEAMRSFADMVTNEETIINKHPKDYTLYKVGEFDTETGLIEIAKEAISLANGNDFKQGEEK